MIWLTLPWPIRSEIISISNLDPVKTLFITKYRKYVSFESKYNSLSLGGLKGRLNGIQILDIWSEKQHIDQ